MLLLLCEISQWIGASFAHEPWLHAHHRVMMGHEYSLLDLKFSDFGTYNFAALIRIINSIAVVSTAGVCNFSKEVDPC